METIKTRLGKFLKENEDFDGYVFGENELQAFISQELTLLATKIDTRIIDSNFSPHIQIGFGKGTSEAAAIIRAHAKSLEE